MNNSKSSVFESALIGGGVLVLAGASSKLMKDSLGITLTPKNAVKILLAVGVSNYLVDLAKQKKYIDVNRFSEPSVKTSNN